MESLPFPEKLWRMVEDNRYDGIIYWNEDGSGFIVCDGVKFAVSKILVEYKFKSNNFISFLHQLSNYGFHKSDASRKPSKAYHHYKGYFKRGQHELLTKIMLENKELESDVPEDSPVACGQHFSAHYQLDTGFETTPATATVTTSTQQHIKEWIQNLEQEEPFFGAAAHLNNAYLLDSQQSAYTESESMQLTPTAVIQEQSKELMGEFGDNDLFSGPPYVYDASLLDSGSIQPTSTAAIHVQSQLLAAATQTNERSETGYSSAGCLSQDQGLDHGSLSQDQEFVVTMDPNSGPPEGGQSFCLEFDKSLPCSVVSAWAYFGDNHIKVWKTYEGECTMFGKNIPPGNQGLVTVKIKTEAGDNLGETIYTYEDPRKKENEQSLPSKRKLEDFSHLVHKIVKVLKQFENGDDSKQNRPLDSQQGRPNQEKELQPEKILKRLVYAAAEAGARELIEIIFSFSAGRIVFEAYKNESSLPEDIAEDSGHKELAAYLRGITKRYSEEDSTSPGQSKVIDWLELANAFEKIVLEQSEPSSDKDLRQMWEDDIETGYSGDGETSSSSSERESSDSGNEYKRIIEKKKKVCKEYTRPSLRSSCLPAMVPNFTGRQRECDEIVCHVSSQSTRIVSIWGSPGFGKTSVAIAVGHSIQSKELPVCWLSLRGLQSKADLTSYLLSVVRRPTNNQNATRNLSPDDELCQLVAEISDRCVFILDNADDLLECGSPKVKEEVIELLEEILRQNENTTLIVTTRESIEFMDLHFQSHQSVRIRPLEEASSQSLVHELLPNASTSDTTRITQICGHVPLAIRLLCSSISEDNARLSQVLNDFLESSTESILEMLDNPDYPANERLELLIDSSFRRLSECEKETLVSLSVLPERFDTEVAEAVLGKTRILTKKILQSLGRKSLLDSSVKRRPFTMHKLIQSFARERGEHQMKAIFLDSKVRLCAHYVSLLDKLNNQFLTGHSLSAFIAFYEDKQNIVQSLIDGCLDSETADCVFDVLLKAEMFLDLIFWTQSEATNFHLIYDSALKAASRQGKSFYYRRLLASKAFSQITWGAKGMTLQLLSEVKEIKVAAYPVTPDEKAKYLCYFGICQLVTGETEIGVQSLQEAISSMGKSPEQTILRLVIFQILAVYYQVKNNLSSSTNFYRKAHRESTAIGDEQLLVIPAIERTTVKTDERKVTQRCTDTLNNQPLKLQVIYHVKRASQHFLDKETNTSLRDMLLKTLNDVEAALPSGAAGLFSFHCVVVAMLMNYNECKDTVKFAKTQISYNQIQQQQSAKSVEEYPASSSKLHTDIGEVQDLRDSKVNSSDALQLRQSATDIAVKRFGESHPSTAECYQTLGITQHQFGDFTSALQSFQRALTIRRALFGEDHQSTAESYQSLGKIQRALGDLSSALQSTQRALKIRRALFGEVHPSTADSYQSLGITQHMLGDFSSALQSTQRALNTRRALFGEDHSSTADSFLQHLFTLIAAEEEKEEEEEEEESLGATQHDLGDFSSALQSTQKALTIRCALFGEDHPSTADSSRKLLITLIAEEEEEEEEEAAAAAAAAEEAEE